MGELVPIKTQVPAFTMDDVRGVAEAIARGGLFGSKDPYAVLTLCLLAQAEGQHPAVVFRDYHIISGKPAKKADAMLRDYLAGGGKVEWHQLDDDCADATFSHPAGGTARISWDKARVKQAQLGGNAMHAKYPRQMLRARTISEGVRTVYPGATSGLYVPEEAATFDERPQPSQEPLQEAIEDHSASNGPAPRTKLDGPHKSKTALKNAVHGITSLVRSAETVEQIDAALRDNKATINQAARDWPELLDGDPGIEEDIGLKGATAQRRAELAADDGMLARLRDGMRTNMTEIALAKWVDAMSTLMDDLSDADRRVFEEDLAAYEAGLKLVAVSVTA